MFPCRRVVLVNQQKVFSVLLRQAQGVVALVHMFTCEIPKMAVAAKSPDVMAFESRLSRCERSHYKIRVQLTTTNIGTLNIRSRQ
jgi:lauroyl/myristoyl acyltransferase